MVVLVGQSAKEIQLFNNKNLNNINKMYKKQLISQPDGIIKPKKTIDQVAKIIEQELKFAKQLAGNDPRVVGKQLKLLKNWLTIRSKSSFGINEENHMRLWKGLFYSMWMSDKPLVQEDLAERISMLVHCFEGKPKISIDFYCAFLKTMHRDWFGIDQWRIDKFMMLVRRCTRQIFIVLHKNDWNIKLIKHFRKGVFVKIFTDTSSISLSMHFVEIYIEEIAKITNGNIAETAVTELIKPFGLVLAKQTDRQLTGHIIQNIFHNLLLQSDRGRGYQQKMNAWKSMGFPGKSLDDLEPVDLEDSEGEEEEEEDEEENGTKNKERPLDPRAGRVDVIIPEIPFDPVSIYKFLEALLYREFTNVKSRKLLSLVIYKYKTFAEGNIPFAKRVMNIDEADLKLPSVEDKVNEIVEFENELYGQKRALKKLNKKKRRKLLQQQVANPDSDPYTEYVKNMKASPIKRKTSEWHESDLIESDLSVGISSSANTVEDFTVTEVKKTVDSDECKKEHSVKRKKKNIPEFNEQQKIELKNAIKKAIINKLNISSSSSSSNSNSSNINNDQDLQQKNSLLEIFNIPDDWSTALENGEKEYYIPSRKIQVQKANEKWNDIIDDNSPNKSNAKTKLLINPFAMDKKSKPARVSMMAAIPSSASSEMTPTKRSKPIAKLTSTPSKQPIPPTLPSTPSTPIKPITESAEKRVKFMLKLNKSQDPNEYIQQLRLSPQVPFDSKKLPGKGLLKPNAKPSPINPYYRKKMGLDFNDTM